MLEALTEFLRGVFVALCVYVAVSGILLGRKLRRTGQLNRKASAR